MRVVRTFAKIALACLVATSSAGCLIIGNPFAPTADSAFDLNTEVEFCVAEVNRLRAREGKGPLARAGDVGEFSGDAARVDGELHESHRHFRDTNGGDGLVRAENEIPWWPLNQYGNVRTVIAKGLLLQINQGAGGPHYTNMTGEYREVSCGIFVANGEVTVTQHFR